MNFYIIVMNSFPKNPYIGKVKAKSMTAAKQIFISYLTDKGFFRAKKTPSAYTAELITKKHALTPGVPAINFEREE